MRARALLGVALALSACSSDTSPELWPEREGPAYTRRFSVEQWDTLWMAGSSAPGDTTLLLPYPIQATPKAVYVFDAGGQRLLAFDPGGRLLWSMGRKGGGPGEFRNVRDLKLTRTGTLLLLDPENNRITEVDTAGGVRAEIPLTLAGHAEQMTPLADGRILLVASRKDVALLAIDRTGRVLDTLNFAWKDFTALPTLARQGLTAVAPDGRSWVYGFMLGDGWFPFDGARPERYIGRYVDHRSFPRVEERAVSGGTVRRLAGYSPCTGCDVFLADSSLYVLAGGSNASRRAVIDRFRWRDGGYAESMRIPVAARKMAVVGDVFYLVVNEPYPAVLALRPRRAPDTLAGN
jgi:hypothetical protein